MRATPNRKIQRLAPMKISDSTQDAPREFAAMPGSASFPSVDYTQSDFHFTINFTVWMGGASICFCDREDRAKLVARAFNHWLQSDDARKWWAEITQKPNSGTERTGIA